MAQISQILRSRNERWHFVVSDAWAQLRMRFQVLGTIALLLGC